MPSRTCATTRRSSSSDTAKETARKRGPFLYTRAHAKSPGRPGYNQMSNMADAPEPQKQKTPEQTAAGMKSELQDRSQFIRTMAKDMAALSAGAAAGAPVPTPPPAAPAPEPAPQEPVAGVWLPKAEEPFFSRPEPKEPEPVPLPPITETVPVAPPAPGEDRAAILDRLRKKVSESAQMSIQDSPAPAPATQPAPAPEKSWPEIPTPPASFAQDEKAAPPAPAVPAWQNVPAPLPEFAPLAEPAPSRMPPLQKTASEDRYREVVEDAPAPRPIAAPAPMHTYSSDFAGRIDQRGASTFTVLAAEQDAGTPASAAPAPKRGGGKVVLAIVSGVLLMALGAAGVYGTYRFVMTMRDTPVASFTLPTTVHADEFREIEGSGGALLLALAGLTDEAIVPGNVLVTYVNADRAAADGTTTTGPAGAATFLRSAQVPAPDILLRNLGEESSVGIVSVGGSRSVFFALRVDSYERTYAGMLTWEPLMARDLGVLFPLYTTAPAPAPEPNATSTATSTATTSAVVLEEPQAPGVALTRFADAIVGNRDVRILRDSNGKALIVYGYTDKRTLIIARDEAAFSALAERVKGE